MCGRTKLQEAVPWPQLRTDTIAQIQFANNEKGWPRGNNFELTQMHSSYVIVQKTYNFAIQKPTYFRPPTRNTKLQTYHKHQSELLSTHESAPSREHKIFECAIGRIKGPCLSIDTHSLSSAPQLIPQVPSIEQLCPPC